MNWSLCMFCQILSKKPTHKVQTLNKSAEVIELAKNDPIMRPRLCAVNDLIAVGACYHPFHCL